MNHLKARFDRLRIELTSARYDFWLDLYGTKRKERRSLRRELTANMISASHELDYPQARRNLGSIRTLAHTQTQPYLKRPSAQRGLKFSALTFSLLLLLTVFYNIFLVNTLQDLQAAGEIPDPVSTSSLLGGTATVGANELTFEGSFNIFGWQSLILLLAFAIGSRPWLIARRTDF